MACNIRNSLQRRILNVAQIQDGNTILDVGCGEGAFAILTKLKFPNTRVFGLDPDREGLMKARQKAQKEQVEVRFIEGVAEEIPYEDNIFDVVVSSLMFHHLQRTAKQVAIREIYRVLKPSGTFYLVDFGQPKTIFGKFFLSLAAQSEPGTYFKDNLEGNLPVFLKDTGFTVNEARRPYLGLYFWQANKF